MSEAGEIGVGGQIIDLAAGPGSGGWAVPKPNKYGVKVKDWNQAERLFVQGEEVDGEWVWPTLDGIAKRFGVTQRRVAQVSVKNRWMAKRADYQKDSAIRAHRKNVGKLLAEMERFNAGSLSIARLVHQEVLRIFAQHREEHGSEPMSPMKLEATARAAERAQKIGHLALNMPTELIEEKDRAEQKMNEMQRESGVDRDAIRVAALEALVQAESTEFLRAVDTTHGMPPWALPEGVPESK
jgi:hypothetical protein